MQTTHKIAGSSADAYAAYLASTTGRGDYYTAGSGGEGEGVQSRWHGSPELLGSLGLSADEPVGREELTAVMRGVSPVDGRELRAAGGNGSRVAGIDMTFSAPKSVSALWAVSSPYERARIEAAHARAVASTIGRVERDVELLRSRVDGRLRWERAERLLAAEFVHTASRLTRGQERGGVPDPQLHTHVVVLGAQRMDGRFAAVDSRELFRSARGNGAWYRAELAHGLQQLGVEVRGQTGRDGRYFEVAGVPEALSERWSVRTAEIDRAARAFRTRYGRDPRAGELGSLTTATRGTKTVAEPVNVDASWRAVAEEYGLSDERVRGIFAGLREVSEREERDLAAALARDVTAQRSTVSDRELHARAYELSAGVCCPAHADVVLAGLVRSGELVALEGGLWTTRELRELEQRTLALAASRVGERVAPVAQEALRGARLDVQREIGAPLSVEQRDALAAITGRNGVSVLVGQAGTGKGVVISAAVGAWRSEGYEVIGTAVAGATAERLGADAGLQRSVTTDRLLREVDSGRTSFDSKTVVVMDEAGIADTARLAALTEATARGDSKLLLVGDQAQLSSIGAGGMFAALQDRVPTAELTEVHRARHGWERDAWAQVRGGEAERALAAYQVRERLHITDNREEAANRMVADWTSARSEHPGEPAVMLTDASNVELDRINALAQQQRALAGELGAQRVELPDRGYGLAAGDEVIFSAAFYPPGQDRVENGTLATVASTERERTVSLRTRGANEREVKVDTRQFDSLRLAYAQHVYKAQGRTVDHAFVLTGGWQTDRERAYVAITRARERTDLYLSREDLGEQGMDTGAIERLGEAMAESHAQQASIATPTRDERRDPPVPERESEAATLMRATVELDRDRDYERDIG